MSFMYCLSLKRYTSQSTNLKRVRMEKIDYTQAFIWPKVIKIEWEIIHKYKIL